MFKRKKHPKTQPPARPVRLPRSVQQLVPVQRVYPDALWQVGATEYSKTWSFTDINYAVASLEDQTTILDSWGRVLNTLASDSRLKITLVNRLFNQDSLSGSIFLKKQEDGLDKYRAEVNRVLMDKAKGSNGIVQEKYLTLTATRKNVEEARMFMARAGKGFSIGMQRLSSSVRPMENEDRFRILHDFFRPDHRTQAVYLRGCEQLANALLQELTALCAMDEKGRLSPENAEKLSALGLHVPDTLPAPPQSDADVVGNYHLSGLLQAYHYLSEFNLME